MVLLGLKDLQGHLDHKVHWELLELEESKDPMEMLALQEVQDLRVKEEILGHQEHREILVVWVQLDPMDNKVIRELVEPLDHQVTLELLVHKVPLETLDKLDHKGLLGLRAQLVQQVLKEPQEMLVQMPLQQSLHLEGTLGHKVPQEHQGLQVLLDHLDKEVTLGVLGR